MPSWENRIVSTARGGTYLTTLFARPAPAVRMAIGDVRAVDAEGSADVHYLDTGMYDVAEYGTVYLVDADRPAVVDTGIGTDYGRLVAAMDEVGIDADALEVIALTHIHLDHAGGAGLLAADCPNATVYVHSIGAPYVVDPGPLVEGTKRAVGDQWAHYTPPEPVPESRVHPIDHGDLIGLGSTSLEVHHVPGHAPHQVCFVEPSAAIAFTGDAAGIWARETGAVLPSSPPPNFDFEQAVADARAIADLDPSVLCYGHFGPAPAGDKLARYAEALTGWVEEIEALRADLDDDAVIERMVERTDDYDVWGVEKARYEVAINVEGVLHYLDTRGD